MLMWISQTPRCGKRALAELIFLNLVCGKTMSHRPKEIAKLVGKNYRHPFKFLFGLSGAEISRMCVDTGVPNRRQLVRTIHYLRRNNIYGKDLLQMNIQSLTKIPGVGWVIARATRSRYRRYVLKER